MDKFAAMSHNRAENAQRQGLFAQEIVKKFDALEAALTYFLDASRGTQKRRQRSRSSKHSFLPLARQVRPKKE